MKRLTIGTISTLMFCTVLGLILSFAKTHVQAQEFGDFMTPILSQEPGMIEAPTSPKMCTCTYTDNTPVSIPSIYTSELQKMNYCSSLEGQRDPVSNPKFTAIFKSCGLSGDVCSCSVLVSKTETATTGDCKQFEKPVYPTLPASPVWSCK